MQAMEVIKLICGYGEALRGALLVMDLASMQIQRLTLEARPDCPDCSHLQA
jgi:adenylyltransferase/sulfurtransferase